MKKECECISCCGTWESVSWSSPARSQDVKVGLRKHILVTVHNGVVMVVVVVSNDDDGEDDSGRKRCGSNDGDG